MAASSTLLTRLKAGRCFNTVEVWLLRFWEAPNDRFAINSESMEGSLVLALMLDEASSPVSRLSPAKLESSMLVPRKKILITFNSPTSRFTYQKALASKTYVGTSFAGPWMEDKRISSWWMVDLGEDHQTMGQEHAQGPESFRYEGINRWENMDGLENSTVTSVENYTVMKWHVNCLHYTRVPFNYHI
ncbi:hypothetical protein Bca4012_002308 [Brassica carinata]